MGFDIGTIGQGAAMQAASGLVGTGLGLLLEGHNDRRQLTQQGKLNELSVKSQKELLEAQRQKELQMWQDTNYSAQIEQMKKAGVNPALLYGQSGGGGTTTGGSGQGINNTGAPTGGGEILAMQGMGLDAQMMQANIELAKSQANLNNVKAGNEGVGGVVYNNIQEQTKQFTANIQNTEAQTAMTKVLTNIQINNEKIQSETLNDIINTTKNNAIIAAEQAHTLKRENKLNDETYNEQLQGIIAISAQNILKKTLIQSEINMNVKNLRLQDMQINQMANSIAQKWQELKLKGRELDQKDIGLILQNRSLNIQSDYNKSKIKNEQYGYAIDAERNQYDKKYKEDMIKIGKTQNKQGWIRSVTGGIKDLMSSILPFIN